MPGAAYGNTGAGPVEATLAVEFRVLGAVEARLDGQLIDIGHARQRCVLVALLVEPNSVTSTDQLIDRVWGQDSPQRARATLHTYLTRLRRALARSDAVGIARQRGGYVLTTDALAVDLHHFRRLVVRAAAASDRDALPLFSEALSLWHGEPFSGLDNPWLTAVRATLNNERSTAELDHADVALRCGQHAQMLTTLQARATDRPFDERLASQLMLALYRSGRQADALDHYHQVRRRLAEELGTDPGPMLQQLHQQIIVAHPVLTDPTGTVWSAHTPVPRQLPAAPRLFTGRARELAALTANFHATATSSVVMSVISGSGGIGKTSLALRWAHQHIAQFPDGQLYVNLRGFDVSEPPVCAVTALRGFLDALGVHPSAIPAEIDAQAALYRSLVADKRMLVVLDNARDSAQVTSLLPGSPSCTVLITSRSQLAGLVTSHGATREDLGVLNAAEAKQLLARHVTSERLAAEPAAVAALLTCCAGWPLALRIVAARASAHPDFPLTVLAAELQESSGRLDALDTGELGSSIRAVLSCSYRALNAEAASMFEQLGLAPGPDISLPGIASLTALPTTRTRAVLRDLEGAHLVTQHVPGRYRMHDLVRLFAVEQQRAHDAHDIGTDALRRLVDFYLHTAYANERLLYPHRRPLHLNDPAEGTAPLTPANEAAAMGWFAAEHPGLLAAQRVAAQHGWHDTVWQIAWSLNAFHRRESRLHDDLTVWQAGLTAARASNDHTAHILAHQFVAHACVRAGKYGDAVVHMRAALTAAEHDDVCAHNEAPGSPWPAQVPPADLEQALDIAIQALSLYRTRQDPLWEADMLDAVGYLHAFLGHHSEAHSFCEAALGLFRRHHDPIGEAAALCTLGYVNHQVGRHTQALTFFREALAIRRDVRNKYGEADTLSRLGEVLADLGQHAEARHAWHQALELYQAQHRTEHLRSVQQHLADLSLAPGLW